MEPAESEANDRTSSRSHTLVYDGECNVCTRTADLLREWDRDEKLEIVPSQAPGVKQRFHWIPEANFAESIQLVAVDGRAFQGARAIEELLNILPKGKLIAWLFK